MKYKKLFNFIEIVMLVWGYTFYVRKKKEKEQFILNQKKQIYQKLLEKQHLKQEMNEAFTEIRQLAKQNAPSFLTKFKELYPEFCHKLLSLHPNIINSEFTFCAYLKLNFSTKEIAMYTFVTEKAVQARKSRIRKKLNISSEVDLYIWFNKI